MYLSLVSGESAASIEPMVGVAIGHGTRPAAQHEWNGHQVGLIAKRRLRRLFRRFLGQGSTDQEDAQDNRCPHNNQRRLSRLRR